MEQVALDCFRLPLSILEDGISMVTTWQKYHPHLLFRTIGMRVKRLVDEAKDVQIEAGVFEDASLHVRVI